MLLRPRILLLTGLCALIGCGDDPTTSSASNTDGSSSTGTASTGSPTTGTTADTSTGDDTTGAPTSSATDSGTTAPTTSPTTSPTTAPDTDTGDTGSSTGPGTGEPDPACGDGVADLGVEDCDGADLGGQSCVDLGFDGGALGCLDTCKHDTSGCTACGDGVLDPGETCDDGNQVAGDGCDASCAIEACDPDGPWKLQGPAIAYTCCVGLVNVNIDSFIFSGDGASIAGSPSNPVAMTGAATTCPKGEFANQGVLQGGCTETFKLTGSFTDANTWKGTYVIDFEGQQCSCFNGQLGVPCIDQSFPVTATR